MNSPDAHLTATSVKDLKPGDTILQFLELKSKALRKTKSGQDYLDLSLGDATGTISCKVWSDTIRKWGHDYESGDFVKVEGRIEAYKDHVQLVVDRIRRADTSEIPDLSAVVRSSKQDPDALFDELRHMVRGLVPPALADLVGAVLDENAEAFKTYPAARMIHHAYRGGLIEHVAAVIRKVEAVLQVEPTLNRNLALAGALLHDIGKTVELAPQGQGRTPEGRLIGHVILGVELIRDAAIKLGCADQPWLWELEHIVLSHHGETQFGAPVKPLTREAVLVHFIDNLDAKLKILDEALESADADGFSPYNKWLEGRAFAGSGFFAQEEDNVGD